MGERVCTADGGWEEIAAALAAAEPGDTVRLAPGTFEGTETLHIPNGVALIGADREGSTVLRFTSNAPALAIRNVRGVRVADLALVMTVEHIAPRALTEVSPFEGLAAPVAEWGALFADRAVDITLEDLHLSSETSTMQMNGISLRLCERALTRSCTVSTFGRGGIFLASTVATSIDACRVASCRHGIALGRCKERLDRPSQAYITSNTCHHNERAGIILASSDAEVIEGNECLGSRTRSGITLMRDLDCPQASSNARRIIANHCYDNEQDGIILFSSKAEVIERNKYSGGRTGSGIVLKRDPSSPEAPSTALVVANRCYNNEKSGILLLSSDAEAIEDNECWGSRTAVGIMLERSSESSWAPSTAVRIAANRCHDNEIAGIVLLSSKAEVIESNECWGSRTRSGIMLHPSSESPQVPSIVARIVANRCHDNEETGILLHSSKAGVIEGNECWGGRAGNGIALERYPESPQVPSMVARIVANRCHDNEEPGIVLHSSQAEEIKDNECWGSRSRSGIVLRRSSESPQAPSFVTRISSNQCYNNEESGIVLLSSNAGAVEDNECWGSRTLSGIALGRDLHSSHSPSTVARIVANRCHDNEGAGILLGSSDAEVIEGNECWGSRTRSGILLGRHPDSLQTPSTAARIATNRCHDNEHAGIALLSAEAEVIEDNECWGSRTLSGIGLERHPHSPQTPSVVTRISANWCHDNEWGGIFFGSSEAGVVEDNECWGNRTIGGIVLGRSLVSPQAPSASRIIGNRCHGNAHCGFDLGSADVLELRGNRAWSNGTGSFVPSPLCLDAAASVPRIMVEPAPGAILGKADQDAQARLRASSTSGALADRLEAEGFARPDALARFLAGPGCPGCLSTAWTGRDHVRERALRRPLEEDASPPFPSGPISPGAPEAAAGARASILALDMAEWPRQAAFRPLSDRMDRIDDGANPLTTRFVEHAADTLSSGQGRTVVIAAIGLEGSLDGFVHDLAAIDAARMGRAAPTTSAARRLVRQLEKAGRGLRGPLDVDCVGRAALALRGEVPDHPLLEDPLAATAHLPRVGFLLRPRQLALQAALLLGVIAVPTVIGLLRLESVTWSGPEPFLRDTVPRAIATWASGVVNSAQPWDLLAFVAALVFWPAAAVGLANRHLPSRLRLAPRGWVERLVRAVGLSPLLSLDADDHPVWRRWVRRRLFRGGLLPPLASAVLLRDPDQWSPDDAARLRTLVTMRGEDQCLVVVMALRTASQLVPAALAPFASSSDVTSMASASEVGVLEGVDAVEVAAVPIATALDLLPGGLDELPAIEPLLGLPDEDDEARDEAMAALRDDRWTRDDLIPMLVMGSAHSGAFVLDYDRQNAAPSLAEVCADYARFVSDEPHDAKASLAEPRELVEVQTRARAAASVLIQDIVQGRRARVLMIGRSGFRTTLAHALRHAYSDEAERFDYIHRLLGCGEIHHVGEAARHLAGSAFDRAVRHMRAAVELRGQRKGWDPGHHRTAMLREAWHKLASALGAATMPAGRDGVELHSLLLHAAEPLDGIAPDLSPEIAARSDAVLLSALEELFDVLHTLDPDYALDLVRRQLVSAWTFVPSGAVGRILDHARERVADALPLSVRLACAPDFETFAGILQRHGEIAPSALAASLCLVVRNAQTDEMRLRIAHVLQHHAKTGLAIDTDTVVIPMEVTEAIIDHLEDGRIASLLAQRDMQPLPQRPLDLSLGPLDPINQRVRRVIEITMSEK